MNQNHHRYESIKKLLDALPSKGFEFLRFIEDCFWEVIEIATGNRLTIHIHAYDDGRMADII